LSPPTVKVFFPDSLYQTWAQLFNFQKLIWTSLQLDPKWKRVVRELALHDYHHVSTFFYRNRNWTKSSFAWSSGFSEGEVENKLVQTGLINHGWYKSNQYNNPTWYIPKYAFPVLDSIKQSPELFGLLQIDIKEICQLIKVPQVMTFVKWLFSDKIAIGVQNINSFDGLIFTIDDDSKFVLWLFVEPIRCNQVIGRLVYAGALTLTSDAGEKSNAPERWTPDTCKFHLTMPFLEALLKEKRLKVDLIYD
jgi:hypothetical protein